MTYIEMKKWKIQQKIILAISSYWEVWHHSSSPEGIYQPATRAQTRKIPGWPLDCFQSQQTIVTSSCSHPCLYFLFFFVEFVFYWIWLIYNVMLVSGVQHSDSDIDIDRYRYLHLYLSISIYLYLYLYIDIYLFQILIPYRLL